MPASKIPNTTPTRTRVRASTPATPIPIAAAKFDRPSERATSTSASTGSRYPSRLACAARTGVSMPNWIGGTLPMLPRSLVRR